MTYRGGTGGLGKLGIPDSEPRLICNGCGVERPVATRAGTPPAWLLDRKAAPGWKLIRIEHEDGRIERLDWCPACKKDQADPRSRR